MLYYAEMDHPDLPKERKKNGGWQYELKLML
jgi:hypothetical protein